MKHGCAGGLSLLASLVQPSVELFRMLDSVIVLSKGKTIYFGPPDEAEEYFNKIGFFRPESKAVCLLCRSPAPAPAPAPHQPTLTALALFSLTPPLSLTSLSVPCRFL